MGPGRRGRAGGARPGASGVQRGGRDVRLAHWHGAARARGLERVAARRGRRAAGRREDQGAQVRQAGEGVRRPGPGQGLGHAGRGAREAQRAQGRAVLLRLRQQRHRARRLGAVPARPGSLLQGPGHLHGRQDGCHIPGGQPECPHGGDPTALRHPGVQHPDPAGQPVHRGHGRYSRDRHLAGPVGRRGRPGGQDCGARGWLWP